MLDDVKLPAEAQASMNILKKKALTGINGFKASVRRRLGKDGLQNTVKAAATKEKMATFGFAAGAFVGFMI